MIAGDSAPRQGPSVFSAFSVGIMTEIMLDSADLFRGRGVFVPRLYLFASAVALALAVATASAEEQPAIHQGISPLTLQSLLAGEDGDDTLTLADFNGDAILDGRVEGRLYSIYFYDCDGGDFLGSARPDSTCLSFEYRAYFDDYPDDGETMNAFNAGHHFGALWRDQSAGDALALHLNVVVEGGVTDANIRASFRWWRETVRAFNLFMEGR